MTWDGMGWVRIELNGMGWDGMALDEMRKVKMNFFDVFMFSS